MSTTPDIRPALLGHLKDLHLPTAAGVLRRDRAAGGTGDAEL